VTTPPPPADSTSVPQHGIPTQPGGYPPPPPGAYPPPPQGGYPAPPQGGYAAPPQLYAQPGYPYPQQVPVSPGGHRLAEFSDRLLARLIDGLILGVASSILIVPLYLVAFFLFLSNAISTTTTVNGQEVIGQPQDVGAFILGILGLALCVLGLTFVMQYIYEVEMMFRSGQTIGKKAMKIRVLPVDPTVPLTRKMAFKRFSVNIAAVIVPGLGWVDGLWQLWDKPWRQCLHDKFAQTLVIRLNP
jgi:uncharacterized RDD family membrane protein YckC